MKQDFNKSGAPQFTLRPRRAISSAATDLVIFEPAGARYFPTVVRPATSGVDLISWSQADRERIQAAILRHGAILFRGFDVRSASYFERFIAVISGQPLPYIERSSPRKLVSGHVYSSTEYPAEHAIFLHSENSYQKSWPLKIFFYCELPAEQGGETPIADTRRILERIRPSVRDKFAEKGVLYVRTFEGGLGLSWQTVFQTADRRLVEQYCLDAGIEYSWDGPDRLKTKQLRRAIQTHPVTGESVWFNHAVFFHLSTLDPIAQQVLRASLPEENLPNNTYYGDGSPIEQEALDHLRTVYSEETVYFPWRRGDILMLDNMLTAHGRSPYCGARKILVGMTEPYSA